MVLTGTSHYEKYRQFTLCNHQVNTYVAVSKDERRPLVEECIVRTAVCQKGTSQAEAT